MNSEAGEIDHRLAVTQQQADEQRCTAVVNVHRPHRVLGKREDVADQLQERRLVVQHPSREQALTLRVDHHAMVMFLADVHAGPDLGHGHLRQLVVATVPQTTSPTLSYTAIKSRITVSGRVVAGPRAAKPFESSNGDKLTAIPRTPGPTILRNDRLRPTLGRSDKLRLRDSTPAATGPATPTGRAADSLNGPARSRLGA